MHRCLLPFLALSLVACTPTDTGEADPAPAEGTVTDADDDGFALDQDCDDADAAVNPAANETCDDIDNDCDGETDEEGGATWYADVDGDGVGDSAKDTVACDAPTGSVDVGGDCDDANAAVYPTAPELCNDIDDNCDGATDEEVVTTWYLDGDDDGFGDLSSAYDECDPPPGYVANADDCDDGDALTFPDAPERCDDVDNDCDGATDEEVLTTWYLDGDDDGFGDATAAYDECDPPPGFVANADDCDDGEELTYPDAPEVCDEQDNDCDGTDDEGVTLTFYADGDADGYGTTTTSEACSAPAGYAEDAGDCDDAAAAVNPDAVESCNGIDDDCDGTADEDDADDVATWHADADGDGYGDAGKSLVSCSAPAGYVASATDCDDADEFVNPDADEVCDAGTDNDCDGLADDDDTAVGGASTWYLDFDSDGYGGTRFSTDACLAPTGYVATDADCDDADADVSPDAAEVCNGDDDDCDGDVDAADDSFDTSTYFTYFLDGDGDSYGDAATTTEGCSVPSGSVTNSTDCDDGSNAVHPGAAEVCNAIDDDCDGATDDDDSGLDTSTGDTWYADGDGDGFGDPDDTVNACDEPAGYVSDDDDCDDAKASVNPDMAEACDGVDNDCDGIEDDGTLGASTTCAAVSCDEILTSDPSAESGAYYLDPEGTGAYLNYCEMDSDGGGWTLVFSCSAPDTTYGSGFDGWWEDGYTTTLDDTADAGKSVAYDEVDFSEIRLSATYPNDSVVTFDLGSVRDDLHELVGTEITTCSGLTGTGRYAYSTSIYRGSFWQSSTVTVVACDTDGADLETTSAGNHDAAVFTTYPNNGDYAYVEGMVGSEYSCGGSTGGYGAVSSNMLAVWVR